MFYVPCPGTMSYDAGSLDQTFRDITFHFGLLTLNSPFDDPNATYSNDIIRRGSGRPIRCERSGNYFPSSRIRRDGNGRTVGDIFWTSGDAKPGKDIR